MDTNASYYLDAEKFTDYMSYLTKNNMESNKLNHEISPLVDNLIRIMNLEVEDRMEMIDAPSGTKMILLFAKNNDMGAESVFATERIEYCNQITDIIVLPNAELLDVISNVDMLEKLNHVYAFILHTKRASAEYISPIEVYKHVFARHFFKLKYFCNSFQLDSITINDLTEDIKNSTDELLDYRVVLDTVNKNITNNVSVAELFDQNLILDNFYSDMYFRIMDELNEQFDGIEEEG